MKTKNKNSIIDSFWNFLSKLLLPFCLLCVALVLFLNVFFIAKVPSGSMLNTIKIGDMLLVKNSFFCNEIERGDICVFKKTGDNFLLVKRVVGLPGEKVEMKDGTVYINDKKLKESYVSSECDTNQVFYVPDNSYLFLGDNRANSSDARYWENPYINKKYIKGIVQCKVYPHYSKLKNN